MRAKGLWPSLGLFLLEADVADATFDGEVDGIRRFAVGLVGVLAVFFLEAVNVNGAQSTMDGGHYSEIFGQADHRFANAAVNIGLYVFTAFTG